MKKLLLCLVFSCLMLTACTEEETDAAKTLIDGAAREASSVIDKVKDIDEEDIEKAGDKLNEISNLLGK